MQQNKFKFWQNDFKIQTLWLSEIISNLKFRFGVIFYFRLIDFLGLERIFIFI